MSQTYTTKQGDMWDGIAYSQLGSTAHTSALMLANRKHLGIFLFPAGIVLQLPEVENSSTPISSPPWKQVTANE